VLDEAVIAEAHALGVGILPGVHTPTEMWRAREAGATLLKLFPAPAGGPGYLRAVRGPFPDLRIVPTNGLTADNARAWFEAGAHALGFNSALFPADLVAARSSDEIEARARGLLAACRS
jgi:2-dehydro-3-deoxyphosphogluconate aldolase/(4S)-4-hydroxy-2-oxoglutarate aldolase